MRDESQDYSSTTLHDDDGEGRSVTYYSLLSDSWVNRARGVCDVELAAMGTNQRKMVREHLK